MPQTISIIITGKVQGVFYRQSTKEKAIELKITGTVKNVADGSVHIIATGTSAHLDALVDWCWKGPRSARVTSVLREESSFQLFDSFCIE